MAVDDLWYLSKRDPDTGERLKSKRHGRGKRWRVRWVDPETGADRTESFDRRADADRFDANMQADISRGQYIDPRAGKITIADYAETWRNGQLHRVATAAHVESVIRLHVLPVLGSHRTMASVRSSHIQGWVKDRVTKLSAATVCAIYSGVLAPMFTRAVIDKVIGTTPCMGIRLPEIADGEYVLPTADQVRLIAEKLPDRYSAVAYVAACCGLRTGEIFGLEWDDIDLDARVIRVRRQLKVAKGRAPYFGPTKTKTSVRTVELPQVCAGALVRHALLVPRTVVEVSDDTNPVKSVCRSATPVFLTETMQLVRPSWWWQVWDAAIKESGLRPEINLRALRHYFATVLIFGGANVKTVQMAMGHTTPTITLNTYVGYWPDALDRTRSLVDAAFCTQSVPGRAA